ncbi:MAG TPA: tRNA (adenosine(37)-N6)-threonylcarbamoyltransferase complex dimerization subunit type 1 TsaB [Myxococcota bacterium]|nr:tRNA (adenosine(37)-N6)-threonylcarbamoyltransferase complex dimerization subunit type 1 TsaB [Myxococcota bacterium]
MTDAGRRLLAIEAATDRLSIALFEGDVVRAMCFAPGLRRHAAELLPTLEAILDEAGVGLEAVDAIAVSSGPGSFTSLRIGLSTVKGLAFGRAVETIGVSTLETMAFGALAGAGDVSVGEDEWVVALLDARRGETYAGGFARGAGTLPECVLAEGLYGPESLAAELADRRVVLVSPEGPDWCRDFAPRAGGAVRVVSGEAAGPRADALGRLAQRRLDRGEGVAARALTARYLRRAQAEAKRLGVPAEAGVAARVDVAHERSSGVSRRDAPG